MVLLLRQSGTSSEDRGLRNHGGEGAKLSRHAPGVGCGSSTSRCLSTGLLIAGGDRWRCPCAGQWDPWCCKLPGEGSPRGRVTPGLGSLAGVARLPSQLWLLQLFSKALWGCRALSLGSLGDAEGTHGPDQPP